MSRNPCLLFEKQNHRVQPGETLIGLALLYGVTVADIRSANKMTYSASIEPGQVISILLAKEAVSDPMTGASRPPDENRGAKVGPAVFDADIDDADNGYAAAMADFKIRFFLKVKQGPLLRYFDKGYEMRWIYLVDQHLLDFESASSSTPSRVYEIKYPQAITIRNGTDIQITFTKSKRNHRSVRLYLRASSEEDALEWCQVIDLISRKKIGTSSNDDRHLSFEEYFSCITLAGAPDDVDRLAVLFPEEAAQYPLYNCSFFGFLRGSQKRPAAALATRIPGGEPYWRSSLLKADTLMDDALDAIGDICLVPPYTNLVVDLLLNSYKHANSADPRLHDNRLLDLKSSWLKIPFWFNAGQCERGRQLLSEHADLTLHACVFNALVLCLASPQTVKLLEYSSIQSQDMIMLVDTATLLLLDLILNICSFKIHHVNDTAGHLSRGCHGWERLVRVRAYFSILRRRAMSLFGEGDAWPFDHAGAPLSQGYCTFLLSVVTAAILEKFSSYSEEDKMAIVMLCRYVGHLIGFEISSANCVWGNAEEVQHVAASCYTHFCEKTAATNSAISSLRKVQEVRLRFFEKTDKFVWKLFPGNTFDFSVTTSCGIDIGHTFLYPDFSLGRFGIYLFMLLCRLVFSCISRVAFLPSTKGGIQNNNRLMDYAEMIMPGLCEISSETFMVGLKVDTFVDRKQREDMLDIAE